MKSDMGRGGGGSIVPKSTVADENSTSSGASSGASGSSNSNSSNSAVGEDLSNTSGGAAATVNSLKSSSLIGGVVGLTSLALGVPQPAHQASNIILSRVVSSF